MAHEVVMPKMGESIVEGTIVEWKKNIGDFVKRDEILLEISTDKVDSEIPSPTEGTLLQILFNKNDVVEVGSVIALIGNKDSDLSSDSSKEEEEKNEKSKIPLEKNKDADVGKNKSIKKAQTSIKSKRFYSPLVKKIAKEENVSISELESVSGSGVGGRVNKNDVLKYIESKKNLDRSDAPPSFVELDKSLGSVEEMSHVQKIVAKHMIESVRTSPHVYSTVEVDMTNVVSFVQNFKESFFNKYGTKLTYTPIFLEACVSSIQKFPLINSSLLEDKIHYHKNINLGIAVALPDDSLVVPVISRAEEKNFLGLLRTASELALNAREGKLSFEDVQNATFTLTNPGVFGSSFGMAIINQPNVAILSTGSIEKKPMVKETEFGDAVFVRHSMHLTLGYDHRIINGAYGSKFLVDLKSYLENFDSDRSF